jgi:TnpA family transposase
MSEDERIIGLLSSLYAYGCNCGPTQAAQATGLRKQTIQYMRRHYTGIKQLTEAASLLVDAYTSTPFAQKLGDPGIFMTDSMRFPTLKDSLTARHHFRYGGGKSILLYQHVTSNCICFFTKALLCDVSEAIHMLDGIQKHRSGLEPVINICDSAGKSDLVFGLALLLNIEIWPRVRGRQNLKLWAASEKDSHSHIQRAISGIIQWEKIDRNWQDMIWILASITAGTADPSLIIERLSVQPRHPATEGISELGKASRSQYLLRYGMDMDMRRIVMKYTSRRETWNQFSRNIFHGFGGLIREKSPEGQDELFWFLTVVQNAIVLWNALALEQAVERARQDGAKIEDDDLGHMLPTMVEHINFVGRFNVNLQRQPPFKLAGVAR